MILGTVGEPINKEAWEWYYNDIGRGRCDIVDTWWQTETGYILFYAHFIYFSHFFLGGILMTPIPGVTSIKPGACSHPFFGLQPALLNANTGEEIKENEVKGTYSPKVLNLITACHETILIY